MNTTNRKLEPLLKDIPYKPSISEINKRNREYWKKDPPGGPVTAEEFGELLEMGFQGVVLSNSGTVTLSTKGDLSAYYEEDPKIRKNPKPKAKPKPVIDLNPKRKFDFG
jgi:hypothetical protein